MRRVVKLGRSTLAVTLPKEWVESIKLKKGDYVLAEDGGENTLRLSKMRDKFYIAPKVCVINVDSIRSKTLLTRLIIGAYTVGHELIWLHSRQGIKPEQMMEVNKTLQKLVGLHIVEQTENIVLLQSLADPTKPSLDNSIRRLHLLTYSMLENILRALLEWDRSLLDNVLFTGGECDKIYWLIIRQLLTAASDKVMSDSLGVKSYLWLVGDRAVIRILKTLIRHNESICKWVLKIMENGVRPSKDIISYIVELGRFTLHIQSEAIEALLMRDIEKANYAIEQATQKTQEVENSVINISTLFDDNLLRTALLNVICELKCSILDLKAIAEIAINRGTEESGSYITIETGLKKGETTLRESV
ncbi:MAG: phosphate uptake regulator PhoU [Nitrososphaerales archaeon]